MDLLRGDVSISRPSSVKCKTNRNQPTPIPNLLPSRFPHRAPCYHACRPILPHRHHYHPSLRCASLRSRCRNLLLLAPVSPGQPSYTRVPASAIRPANCLGQLPRDSVDDSRIAAVHPAAVHDVDAEACGQFEYSDDVHSDPGKLCVGD